MEVLTTPVNADKDWMLTCSDGQGNPVVFAGTETLAAVVWPGDGLAASFSPTASFIAPASGTIKLTVAAGQTAALDAGMYRLQVSATSAGRTIMVLDGQLQLTPGPGVGVAPSVYASYADLKQYVPWIEQLQDVYSDAEGYMLQRHRARSWLEDILQARYVAGRLTYAGFSIPGFAYTGATMFSRIGGDDEWLQKQLDNGLLTITEKLREIVSLKAAAYVCEMQVGTTSDAYAQKGAWLHKQAEAMVKSYHAEFDFNADGFTDMFIDCGSFSMRA